MYGIISVSDLLGLNYHYVKIDFNSNQLIFERYFLLHQTTLTSIPVNELNHLFFEENKDSVKIFFTYQNQHYQIKENASLNVADIAVFIQTATFAYYGNYIELPTFLNK
ncbi:hypothetical protein [Carnobacterium divergens]|uniref:hypothetical protein n=1 Tax=Carnobacterium divergens TaxID=2748 RepID=UPI0039B046CA